VPLVLAGAALVLPFPALGGALLESSRWAADLLWQVLESLAALQLSLRPLAAPPLLAVAAACVGAVLLMAPRGFPGRVLGVLWLLPLLLLPVPGPAEGDYWLTLLDVGQGLAAVIRTRSHVMVYDTGPRYAAGFDAGRDVVVPFLRHQGVGRVDLLVISHAHNDHTGGAEALLAALPTAAVMTNVGTGWRHKRPCRAGARWHWDGVDFRILHPGNDDDGSGNDGSCVLQVSAPGGRLLLPGDVEASGEVALVARAREDLRAAVLVVPHHGGRSSSSGLFLDAVRPRLALFPRGHRNRYRFPHAQVVQRLAARGVEMFDTARHGAVTLKFDAKQGIRGPRLERLTNARIWRAQD
jgi:competence protein ComEC